MRSKRFPRVPLSTTIVSIVSLVLAAGSLSAQATGNITGDPISGRQIFEERGCQRCHAIWGNGGTLGPDLATVGAGRSLQQLAGMFWNHTPRMIEALSAQGYQWATFTESQLSDVISYIYYVKLFDEPGDPELGERWFRNKRCVECHSVGGEGGGEGPALDYLSLYLTPMALSAQMWNHGQAMRRRQVELGIPIPTFADRQVADIQAYIIRNSSVRDRRTVFLEPPNPNRGGELFTTKRCTRCHGEGGRGTAIAPDLLSVTLRLSVSAIAGEMWNHSLQMRATMEEHNVRFPRFEGSEMADVIAYLYYLNFYDVDGDPILGELSFFRKGCARCHIAGGADAPIGPDLSESLAVTSPLGLATAMWNHAPSMYEHTRVVGINWPRFENDEMRDLAAYLAELAGGNRTDN